MQITETLSEGLKREYRIVVPAADIEGRIDEKLDRLGQTVPINGFRSGKAPRALLRRRFDKQARGEALRETLDSTTRQAVIDLAVKPALAPRVEIARFEAGADLEFTMALETLPEFEPNDIRGMKLERLTAEFGDARVDSAIRDLAAFERDFRPADDGHAAALGDSVLIDFEGRIDGAPFEGGEGTDFRIVLGSGAFVPGFEEGLVGVRKGETREVTATWPEGRGAGDMAGKTAVFSVAVSDVLVAETVVMDDAFAVRFGMADLAALREAVRERGRREYRAAARMKVKRQILDRLADTHDFAVPEGMVDREFEAIWRQIEQDMKRADETWAEAEQTEEEARAEYRAIAERRVRLGLVLAEIGRRNEIAVPQDDLNRAVVDQARRFPGEEQRIFDLFRSNPEMMSQLHAPLLEDRVIDFIVEMADVTERQVDEKELMAADADEDTDAANAGTAGEGNDAQSG